MDAGRHLGWETGGRAVVRALLYVLMFLRLYGTKFYPVVSFVAISSVVLPAYVAARSVAVILVSVAAYFPHALVFVPRAERSEYRMLYGAPLFGRYGGIPRLVGGRG